MHLAFPFQAIATVVSDFPQTHVDVTLVVSPDLKYFLHIDQILVRIKHFIRKSVVVKFLTDQGYFTAVSLIKKFQI